MYARMHVQVLRTPEVAGMINVEGGMFSSADKTWIGKVEVCRCWMQALAQEHAAAEQHKLGDDDSTCGAYGVEVTRLELAKAAAAEATRMHMHMHRHMHMHMLMLMHMLTAARRPPVRSSKQ